MIAVDRLSKPARRAALYALFAVFGLFLGAVAATADSTEPAPLTLRNHITVVGGSVHLRDIFDGFENPRPGVSGDTIIAYAPQPGRRAVFDANWLARVAQRHRLHWRPTTRLDRVIVERASTVVDATDIAAALRDEIAARGHGENIDLELSNRKLLVHIDSSLPPTIEVIHIATEPRRGRFSATLAIPAGDPQGRRITVAGQFFSVVEVPVPARALRPGSTIRQRDLKWQRVRADQIKNDTVTDPNEFIGREAKRPLSANKMVRQSELRDPVVVSKGMLVTMVFRTASMELTATGRALEAGAMDDFITVRNSQTGATVDARILGPNRVEVAALRQLAASEGTAQ